VVVYMGVAQLPHIVTRLRAAGATPEHPAAIIERATLPGQRILRGTLADITSLAQAHRVGPPAILIVGDVAALPAAEAVIDSLPHAARGVPV
jgi:uroporphyrin-III C-methyltransferase